MQVYRMRLTPVPFLMEIVRHLALHCFLHCQLALSAGPDGQSRRSPLLTIFGALILGAAET